MSRKVPCAVCGEPRWRSSHAGAPARPTCRTCRAATVEHGKYTTYNKRKCRCDLCRAAWNEYCKKQQANARELVGRMVRACVECAVEFNPRANQLTCSPICRKTYLGRLGHNATRAAFFGVAYERFDRLKVFEACGWVCGICELPVDQALKFPDPGSPTLDHIIPMSLGGGHVLSNAQLAHFYCNTVKGAREVLAC